jgi:DtxR family Mn-dependent transcriptional regulator
MDAPHRLVRVLMQDEERLRYLGSLGLYPNVQITLLERAPFDGPLLIDVDGAHHALAHEMAKFLVVSPWEEMENV